ncbi:putative membrane protein YkoI [Clostridiales Family XIII bacterium PM5-7]
MKLTKDDGRWIYEGEAYRNGYEYDFEVNAYTGRFIEWEKDRVD